MIAPPIRIAIDARPLAGPPCGYTVYLCSILHCLRGAGFEMTLLGNQPLLPHYDEAIGLQTLIFGSGGHLRWEQRDLPRHLATAAHDLYFSGANRGIPLRKTRNTRYLLGLLDVIPYLFFGDYYLRRWKTLLRHPAANTETVAQLIAIARADAILTISQQSAHDIRRIFRRRAVAARLIRLKDAGEHRVFTPKPQFVYVGGVDARKKVDVLLRGFAAFAQDHPDHRLVLVGSNYAALQPLIGELGIQERVDLTGYVDHDTKFRILGESLAMVYPSLYEGYGMAIAEGFQAGIPVIAGHGGSQGEVGGSGVRLIDPGSATALAQAMVEMLNPTARAAWIERGQHQLARLTSLAIETATVAWFDEQGRIARGAN
jgi:glycosyltransferase involved in cell wall biosynthesis